MSEFIGQQERPFPTRKLSPKTLVALLLGLAIGILSVYFGVSAISEAR